MERAVLYVRKRPTSPENILKLKAGLFGGKISHFLSPLLSSLPLFPPREYIYVCVAPRLSLLSLPSSPSFALLVPPPPPLAAATYYDFNLVQ